MSRTAPLVGAAALAFAVGLGGDLVLRSGDAEVAPDRLGVTVLDQQRAFVDTPGPAGVTVRLLVDNRGDAPVRLVQVRVEGLTAEADTLLDVGDEVSVPLTGALGCSGSGSSVRLDPPLSVVLTVEDAGGARSSQTVDATPVADLPTLTAANLDAACGVVPAGTEVRAYPSGRLSADDVALQLENVSRTAQRVLSLTLGGVPVMLSDAGEAVELPYVLEPFSITALLEIEAPCPGGALMLRYDAGPRTVPVEIEALPVLELTGSCD